MGENSEAPGLLPSSANLMKALRWAISSSKWKSVSFSPEDNWEGSVPSFRSFEHQVGVASGDASLHAWVSGLMAVLPGELLALSPEILSFAPIACSQLSALDL